MEEELGPLLIVELLFRAKDMTTVIPHAIKIVSLFLDSSVDLPLHKACQRDSIELLDRIWTSSDVYTSGIASNLDWTLRKYIRTDHHYRQYQFTLSLTEAVRLKNLEMVGRVVNIREIGVGLEVQWTGQHVFAATATGHGRIVWWLRTQRRVDVNGIVLALETAVLKDDIPLTEWLLANGSKQPIRQHSLETSHLAAASGQLDVLEWLFGMNLARSVNTGMLVVAAEKGHLNIVQWLIHRDTTARHSAGGYGAYLYNPPVQGIKLIDLGGEASLAIHTAAVSHSLSMGISRLQNTSVPRQQVQLVHCSELKLV